LAVFVIARFLPGVSLNGYQSAFMLAVVLAFLNAIVKPVLTFLTIPITIFTLGLFLLVINAGIILMAQKLVAGFSVNSFWTAMLFSLILSFSTGILNALFGLNDKEKD